MITKGGRLFLWKNISDTTNFYFKIGSGATEKGYVEIGDSKLESEIVEDVTIEYSKDGITWTDGGFDDIYSYISESNRQLVIYLKISSEAAIEFNEIGLFAEQAGGNDILLSKNYMERQHISGSENKIIRYTINI